MREAHVRMREQTNARARVARVYLLRLSRTREARFYSRQRIMPAGGPGRFSFEETCNSLFTSVPSRGDCRGSVVFFMSDRMSLCNCPLRQVPLMKIVNLKQRVFGKLVVTFLSLMVFLSPSARAEFREPLPGCARVYLYRSVPTDPTRGHVGLIRLNREDCKTVESFEISRCFIEPASPDFKRIPLSEVSLAELEALWGKPTVEERDFLSFQLFGSTGKVFFIDLRVSDSVPLSYRIRGKEIKQEGWFDWQ